MEQPCFMPASARLRLPPLLEIRDGTDDLRLPLQTFAVPMIMRLCNGYVLMTHLVGDQSLVHSCVQKYSAIRLTNFMRRFVDNSQIPAYPRQPFAEAESINSDSVFLENIFSVRLTSIAQSCMSSCRMADISPTRIPVRNMSKIPAFRRSKFS